MNYRCLKCGGKMQNGGMSSSDIVDKIPLPAPNTTLALPSTGVTSRSLNFGKSSLFTQSPTRDSVSNTNIQSSYYDPAYMQQSLGLLSEISGRVERNRQNQYDMQQQAVLGLMNPMPVNDFQPNPYSLYARYGGSIKNIVRDMNKFSNNAEMRMDTYAMGGKVNKTKYRGK